MSPTLHNNADAEKFRYVYHTGEKEKAALSVGRQIFASKSVAVRTVRSRSNVKEQP
jgi:hypothetical protein